MSDPSPSSALTPELVEQMARCAWAVLSHGGKPTWKEIGVTCREVAHAILAEALPAIRAQALREAARGFDDPLAWGRPMTNAERNATIAAWLRELAVEAQP